jgi:hypothetical protein
MNEVAAAKGSSDWAPIVSPDLAKKVAQPRFAGNNMDDLTEGIHPLMMMPQDHSNEDDATLARDSARAYDDLVSGSSSTSLDDIQRLRQSTKAILPDEAALAKAQLLATKITFVMLLGSTHPFNGGFGRFITKYINRDHFYNKRLIKRLGAPAFALFLCYIQLLSRGPLQSEGATTSGPRLYVHSPAPGA